MSVDYLKTLAGQIRAQIVDLCHRGKTAHLASALSCVDILVAAYWEALRIDPAHPKDPGRDRLILSKGHAALALYATLARRGFFSEELLSTYAQPGSPLSEHPGHQCAPGVELATGSLGHGLPTGVGMALAGKIQQKPYRVFVILSDGECNEGSVWEAAMMAAAHNLDNVVVVVDFNKWQATGRSTEVMALEPLADKWKAFGWSCQEIDGHDITALVQGYHALPHSPGRPTAIIAHTVKGKGVSFMEDDNNWHYRVPTEEEVFHAYEELGVEVS